MKAYLVEQVRSLLARLLRPSRTLALAIITLLGLLVITTTFLTSRRLMREITEHRVAAVLSNVLETTVENLYLWAEQKTLQASIAGQSTMLADVVSELSADAPTDTLVNAPQQQLIAELLDPVLSDPELIGYFVIDLQNRVVSSTFEKDIGHVSTLTQYPDQIENLMKGSPFILMPSLSTALRSSENSLIPVILVGAPIMSEQHDVIGGLVLYVDPNHGFSDILQRGHVLETGETYLIDQTGLMLSHSRFEDHLSQIGLLKPGQGSALNLLVSDPGVDLTRSQTPSTPSEQWPLTFMAADASSGNSGSNWQGYRDYRGVQVVGTWQWIDQYQIAAVTEADYAESFSNLDVSTRSLTILTAISGLALLGVVFVSVLGDRQELQVRKRFEQTVEGSIEAIIIVMGDRVVRAWNHQAETIFGWAKAEVVGYELPEGIFPTELLESYFVTRDPHNNEDLAAHMEERQPVELFRRDGTLFPADIYIIPIERMRERGVSLIIRDLSEIKAAEAEIQHSHELLEHSYDATLRGWSHALDLRDNETEGHSRRVTEGVIALARSVGVPEADLIHMYRGAVLHDIGKIGIPDSILLKPGPLDDDEWEIMKSHTTKAYQILKDIPYLEPALDIPIFHHEKWNGTGYPNGLKGEEIPYPARLFSIVDVSDALLSDRPYRKAWREEEVYQYIVEQRGQHFDPQVVDAFLEMKGWINRP